MAQMKEQNNPPEKELNETKITNLSDAEFKTLVSVCSKNSWGTTTTLEKTQAEMKVVLSEIRKSPQGTNSGGDEAEIQINVLERKEEKSIQSEQQEEEKN